MRHLRNMDPNSAKFGDTSLTFWESIQIFWTPPKVGPSLVAESRRISAVLRQLLARGRRHDAPRLLRPAGLLPAGRQGGASTCPGQSNLSRVCPWDDP